MRPLIEDCKEKYSGCGNSKIIYVADKPQSGPIMTTTTDCVSLRERTLYLVTNAPRWLTYTEMSKECGLTVTWISRFARNEFPNPGVNHVQCLHDYLVRVVE